MRAHRCAAFPKRCATVRSYRPFAVAAARKSHARAFRARARNMVRAWCARASFCAPLKRRIVLSAA
eukprot:4063630-Lingulodinium_polyedra.AAC.1